MRPSDVFCALLLPYVILAGSLAAQDRETADCDKCIAPRLEGLREI